MRKTISWEIVKSSWDAQPHPLSFLLPHSPWPQPKDPDTRLDRQQLTM